MKCANCQTETCTDYNASQIVNHKLFKASGDKFYKLAFEMYTLCNVNGRTAFKRTGTKGKFLFFDMVAVVGDAHAYTFASGTPALVWLCSRRCAVAHAERTNSFLKRQKDGVLIFPHQSIFDTYSVENNLIGQIALINEDKWTTIDDEFEGLLVADLPRPDRLLALAGVMIDRGREAAAERAVDSVISKYPIGVAINVYPILGKLNKLDRADALFEGYAASIGGTKRLEAELLSSWAFLLSGHNYQKAVSLSTEALRSKPQSADVIGNHLAKICERDPHTAVSFFYEKAHMVRSDVGLFSAGKALLRQGLLAEAEETLRSADTLVPDPLSKVYLAETLYRLQRHAEALEICAEGDYLISQMKSGPLTDYDGNVRTPSHLPYDHKKYLRKAFLAVEAKALIAIGEHSSGQKRIQDALDINIGYECKDMFFDDVPALLGDIYVSKSTLQEALAQEQRKVADVLRERDKAALTTNKLSDIIIALANAQKGWGEALIKLKDSAAEDLLSEHFLSEIHTFCTLLAKDDRHAYERHRESLAHEYDALPRRVIEQLANAEFLLSRHKDGALPIFAGAIIEYSKAIETSVNEILIRPFISSLWKGDTQRTLEVKGPNGKPRAIEVMYRGNVKTLMLGDAFLFLKAKSTEWTDHCESLFTRRAAWIFYELPDIIKRVKDDFRNGSAHYSSSDRAKAVLFRQFLEGKQVFMILNEIARSSGTRPA
jgi:tetratricopeptide (TPR) repeat protein